MLPRPADIRASRASGGIQALLLALLLGGAVGWQTGSPWWGIAVGLPAALGMYCWSTRDMRRRRRAANAPMPESWSDILQNRVAFYRALDPAERDRFATLVRIFLAETPIVGVGCEPSDSDRVLTAAGAVIPIWGFPRWEYVGLQRVLIHPDSFTSPFGERGTTNPHALGLVTHAEGLLGGLVILSQPDIASGFADTDDKHNVVIHEFAHLIDRATGDIDGIPAGLAAEDRQAWQELVERKLHRGLRAGDIPAYGFTNREEFFAVCSEYFFERPGELQRRHPELYRMLEGIYRQDTRSMFRAGTRRSQRHRQRSR